MTTSLLLSETWTDFLPKKIFFPKHGLVPQILKNDSFTSSLSNMDSFPPKKKKSKKTSLTSSLLFYIFPKREPSLPRMIQLPLPQWCVSHAKNGAVVLEFPSRVRLSFQTTFFIFFFFLEHNLTSCPHTRCTISFHLPKPSILNLLPIIIPLTPPTTFIMLIFFP